MPTARQKGEKGEHKLSRKKKHSFFGHLIYFRVIGKSKPKKPRKEGDVDEDGVVGGLQDWLWAARLGEHMLHCSRFLKTLSRRGPRTKVHKTDISDDYIPSEMPLDIKDWALNRSDSDR